ncbi:hypothetical protein V1264_009334 [Littorina saxatilis]|uniref:Uncharacterized protein n=1 Tax=Littorina saxatilis TaxID=31220 RepID=A0AAN9AR72_9CAEN
MDSDHCPFCHGLLTQDVNTLTKKGLEGIKRASEKRGVDIEVKEGQNIHGKCRGEFTSPHAIHRDLRLKRKREHDDDNKCTSLALYCRAVRLFDILFVLFQACEFTYR